MKDIQEKLIVTLCAFAVLAIILLLCLRNKSSVAAVPESSTDIVAVDTTCCDCPDDFEAEIAPNAEPDKKPAKQQVADNAHLKKYNGRYFSYSKKFANRNNQHLAAAQQIGLSHGPNNRAEAAKMKDQLREIKTNRYYVVEDLTHSLPYLVPTAANRLDSIGKEFNTILTENGLPYYRFRVTSVLRSQEDIRRLKRCNSNSISNSPHNYGTTFDIGYSTFDKVSTSLDSMTTDNLKLVLAQALLNQQRAGHIYVKYEYKQGCFHITTRN